MGSDQQADVLGAISGAVAGLVAITPASGFVTSGIGAAHGSDRRWCLLTA